MEISSLGQFYIPATTPPESPQENVTEKLVVENQSGVSVSISAQARERQDAELNQTEKDPSDKKDFGESLRSGGANASKTDDEPLTAEERLEQRIEQVKEEIKEIQEEMHALSADSSEQAKEKVKLLAQEMNALLGELNNLMEQKLESMRKDKS